MSSTCVPSTLQGVQVQSVSIENRGFLIRGTHQKHNTAVMSKAVLICMITTCNTCHRRSCLLVLPGDVLVGATERTSFVTGPGLVCQVALWSVSKLQSIVTGFNFNQQVKHQVQPQGAERPLSTVQLGQHSDTSSMLRRALSLQLLATLKRQS